MVDVKPLNYLQRAELQDESFLYSSKCKQAGEDVSLSMVVVVKTLKYAGVSEDAIKKMNLEEQIKTFNKVWEISGLSETEKKS